MYSQLVTRAAGGPLVLSTENTKQIERNIGVTLKNNQAKNTASAIANPENFLKARAHFLDYIVRGKHTGDGTSKTGLPYAANEVIALQDGFGIDVKTDASFIIDQNRSAGGIVARAYKDKLNQMLDIGASDALAEQYATEYAQMVYNDQVSMINLQTPGAIEKIMSGAEIDNLQRQHKVEAAQYPTAEEIIRAYKSSKASKKESKQITQ